LDYSSVRLAKTYIGQTENDLKFGKKDTTK
jgi:hypothetical protein